jgi:hypothetical protein
LVGGVLDDRLEIGAGTHRSIDGEHRVVAEPVSLAEVLEEGIVGQAHHLVHDLVGRVVRARLAPQLGVVDVKEVLVEVEVGVAAPPPHLLPLDRSDNPDQQLERHGEARSDVGGEDLEGPAHQRVTTAEPSADLVGPTAQVERLASGQQQCERHRLGVAVSEDLVGSRREEQIAPVGCETGKRLIMLRRSGCNGSIFSFELVEDLGAQEPGQGRDSLHKCVDGCDRHRLPREEGDKQIEQGPVTAEAVGCLQRAANKRSFGDELFVLP